MQGMGSSILEVAASGSALEQESLPRKEAASGRSQRWNRHARNQVSERQDVTRPVAVEIADAERSYPSSPRPGPPTVAEVNESVQESTSTALTTESKAEQGAANEALRPEQQGTAGKKREDRCVICLDGFGEGEGDGMPLRSCRQCNSKFHQACLSEWSKKEQQLKWEQKPWMTASQIESGSCPCCRSNQGHDRSRRYKRMT
mmetsp:Transcript_8294/g.18535  ORF Transcript_8294/g.18535 Transcript_8294/m.18535 type:complete len:202 (+) Transcript_8294:35-640(+)